jgi:predicted RNA-binding protein with PUA-like domain
MAERMRPYESQVNYWLIKTDPARYSFGDLVRDTSIRWRGVTDYASLTNLRDLEDGELALIYHDEPEEAIVGIARIVGDPYPDPEGRDPQVMAVDLEPERWLEAPVPLSDLLDDPRFRDFDLVETPELTVLPVPVEVWNRILEMSHTAVVQGETV